MLRQSFKFIRLSMKNCSSIKYYLILTVVLELLCIAGLYKLNSVYGDLYSSIQDYNKDGIWSAIRIFCIIAGILVFFNGYTNYFINRLAFLIREGLTKHFLSVDIEVDNKEQRIQEDLKRFGELSCDFWFAVFKSVVKLPLFLSVIITLTQWWIGLTILAAVIGGTILTKVVANKLIKLQSEQESNEANFRKNLVLSAFQAVKDKFILINQQVKILSFVQSGLGQTFVLLPFIILLPLYIAKSVTMGAFFQSVNALSKVIDSLTVLIDNRQLIANISTCLRRMDTLNKGVKE